MQTTSATFDRIRAGTDYWYEPRLVIDGVGTYGESDIVSIKTNIEMFQEDPEVGKAIASEVEIVMLNPTATIPNMAKLRPQVRACGTAPKSSKVTITDEDLASTHATYSTENITFDADSGAVVANEDLSFAVDSSEYLESEWLAQGVFFVDTREVTQNNNGLDILTLHGFDAMLKTEQEYSSNVTVGNNIDIAYVRAVASAIGVTVDPRTWEIMQTGYVIPFPLGYTMREILGYIASAYAGCFIISDTGQLRLVAFEDIESETRYLIDEIGEYITFGVDSPQHTVTASGAIASFNASGVYDLTALEVGIEPVQDLHGYSNPYPAGGGANKFVSGVRVTGKYYKSDGTLGSSSSWNLSEFVPVKAEETYTVSGINSSSTSASMKFFDSSQGSLSALAYNGTNTQTFTTPVNCAYISFSMLATAIQPQLNEGSSVVTPWTPYSNICPISGFTQMDLNNSPCVLEFEQGGLYDASGGENNNNNRIRSGFIPIAQLPKATNVFNLIRTNRSDNAEIRRRYFYMYTENKTFIQTVGTNVSFPFSLSRSDIPQNTGYFRLVLQNADPSLRISPTDYKVSINATTIPITWQTTAGTVYKGTLNVLTGVLTVTHKEVVYDGSTDESWNIITASNRCYIAVSDIYTGTPDYQVHADMISNMYETGSYTGETNTRITARNGIAQINIFDAVHITSSTTSSAWRTFLSNNNLQVVYPLATAQTYQLSANQVQTLLGQNNVWSNTGNINTLSFVEPASEVVRILV